MARDPSTDEGAPGLLRPYASGSSTAASGTWQVQLKRNARFVGLCGALLVTLALYWPSSMSLLRMWNAFGSRFYTHGDLIAALAAVALWRRRKQLTRVPLSPRPWGAVMLLALSAVWLVADLPDIEVVHQACIPLLLWGVAYTVFGPAIGGLCRFPALYLYAAIPIWEWIKPPLQALTVAVAGFCLPLVGMPALIIGNLVEIPAGSFEIQTGCAGEAYLIVAVAIAVYCGDILQSGWRTRAALVALAAGLAMVGNWVRVIVIIVMGQVTAMQSYLVRVSHDGFGWAVFGLAMLAFMGLATLMTRRPGEDHRGDPGSARIQPTLPGTAESSMPAFAALVALAALAVAPALSAIARHRVVDRTPGAVLQPAPRGWTGPASCLGTWHPVFAGADVQGLGAYTSPEGEVCLYIADYLSQSSRGKLHGAGNTALGEGYAVQSQREVALTGHVLKELELTGSGGQRWLMWVTYDVGGHVTPSLMSAQLWYALQSLTGAPRSRAVALRVLCPTDCSAARKLAVRFVTANPWILAPRRLHPDNQDLSP